jgi:hypothetical protein
MAAVLVTLATAKTHLRITTADDDVDVQLKLDQAEAIIRDYLDTGVDALWVGPATVPGHVSAAILLALTDLYENRGDVALSEDTWTAITRLLVRTRNAALA